MNKEEIRYIRIMRYGLGIVFLVASFIIFNLIEEVSEYNVSEVVLIFLVILLIFLGIYCLVFSGVLIGGCEAFIDGLKKEKNK